MSVNPASNFSDTNIFQHGTFIFKVPTIELDTTIDVRGNKTTRGESIEVTFWLRPAGGGNIAPARDESHLIETYTGIVVSGDLTLPKSIQPNDVGEGELRGRACTATIKSLNQSSVSPILTEEIGEKVTLEVSYRSRSGNSSNT